MIAFIDEHRDQFGVEAICRTLRATECGFITSRGYRAAKTRPRSSRTLRDGILVEELRRIHAENYSVYGARKMWHAMRRAGWDLGRDQVARLMRSAGLHGVRRGRKPITTCPAQAEDHRRDLVQRDFTAAAPHQLWVADITYVRLVSGFCYVAFITDVCTRKIVGWSMRDHMRTELVEEALTMAHGVRGSLDGAIFHSDHGSVYTSEQYRRLCERFGVTQSMGTIGTSADNSLAESFNATLKREVLQDESVFPSQLVCRRDVFRWCTHYNTKRLHSWCGYRSPNAFEAAGSATLTIAS